VIDNVQPWVEWEDCAKMFDEFDLSYKINKNMIIVIQC
jgi:hypothetical protein